MTMTEAARRFIAKLDEKEMKYTTHERETRYVVRLSFGGDSMDTIPVQVVYDKDNDNIAVRVFSIAKVPENKLGKLALTCSDLNNQYRWIKFYLDSDNEITAEVDGVITVDTSADVSYELMGRVYTIVDEAYPTFMTAIWGN